MRNFCSSQNQILAMCASVLLNCRLCNAVQKPCLFFHRIQNARSAPCINEYSQPDYGLCKRGSCDRSMCQRSRRSCNSIWHRSQHEGTLRSWVACTEQRGNVAHRVCGNSSAETRLHTFPLLGDRNGTASKSLNGREGKTCKSCAARLYA